MARFARHSVRRGAGLAGIGGGSSYLGIISLLPTRVHWAGDLLAFFTPFITVGFGYVWLFLRSLVERKVLNWHIETALVEARANRDRILADPCSTPSHREAAQKAVEALERLQIEALEARVTEVRARLDDMRD